MPIISIIVPVYNVEKYLDRCIKSILHQTFLDYELILVDDGSTDSSGDICDNYAREDNRIVVLHKANGGLSSARNAGIYIARGSYYGFVDSDDYIAPEMYSILLENLLKEDADISVGGILHCYEGNVIEAPEERYFVVDAQGAIELALKGKYTSVNAVDKLYKANVFSDIKYPLNKIAEDAFVIVDIFMKCDCIVINTKPLYYYAHRENSISTKAFSNSYLDIIDAYEKNMKLIDEFFPDLQNVARVRLCWAYFLILDKMILSSGSVDRTRKMIIIKCLKNNTNFILCSDGFRMSRKCALLVLNFSIKGYELLVYLKSKKKYKLFS